MLDRIAELATQDTAPVVGTADFSGVVIVLTGILLTLAVEYGIGAAIAVAAWLLDRPWAISPSFRRHWYDYAWRLAATAALWPLVLASALRR